MRREGDNDFSKPWFLLCEGQADKRFLDSLLQQRGLEGEFRIEHPQREEDGAGGRGKFGAKLNGLLANESFLQSVKGILVVSDNDDDPNASFADVQQQLRQVEGIEVPHAPRVVVRNRGLPAVSVLMIPFDGSPGNLESVCLPSAYEKWANHSLQQKVDAFVSDLPVASWSGNKQAKARMHTIIAATCEPKPDASFSLYWTVKEDFRIPVSHASFDGIAEFIADFPRLVLSP